MRGNNMCECSKLKENLEFVEAEISAMSATITSYEDKIDQLNKKIDLQELIIALRDKEIEELNLYIDSDHSIHCCVARSFAED
jgi:peptidoglycan hydrolase CwlO-like protein